MNAHFGKIPGEFKVEKPDPQIEARLLSLKPYVRQSGDHCRGRWSLGERKLLDYLLVCIIDGNGIFWVEGGTPFPVCGGDLVWIPPDTSHSMRGTGSAMRLAYLHFDLSYDSSRSVWDAHIPAGFTDLSRSAKRIHPPPCDEEIASLRGKILSNIDPVMISLVREICALHRHYGNLAMLELSAMMLRLIARILGAREKKSDDGILAMRIKTAYEEICKEESLKFSPAKFAKSAGMSVSHFRRLFKRLNGQSPMALHRKVLMQKAHDLISYEGLNVSETAERLGFSNIQNFSRAFKSYYGKSPKKLAMM